jgi:hypothetical protein
VINKLLFILGVFIDDMEIILTESQLKRVLTEERLTVISSILSDSQKTTKKIVNDVKKAHDIDFSYLTSYGAVIGGFMSPVLKYISGTYPSLSEKDVSLICFGIMVFFFSDNKEKLGKVMDIIKKEGLVTFFERSLSKAQELKKSFLDFLESLNMTFSKVSSGLAYAFIIPMLGLIYDILMVSDGRVDNIESLIKTYLTYRVTLFSAKTIEELVSRIVKRFRS